MRTRFELLADIDLNIALGAICGEDAPLHPADRHGRQAAAESRTWRKHRFIRRVG